MEMPSIILFLQLLCFVFSQLPDRPMVCGHRGMPSLFPENTIESFLAACYVGADCVELDV